MPRANSTNKHQPGGIDVGQRAAALVNKPEVAYAVTVRRSDGVAAVRREARQPAPLTDDRLATTVRFGDHHYPYIAGSGESAWDQLCQELAGLHADRFVIISENSLPTDLLDEVGSRVAEVAPVSTLTFSGGEPAKTIGTLDALAGAALSEGMTRRSCILAVGGGLVGNVAGLLAALLFRGVRFVQIPTTLLAMSDSVLSLKQAVNSQVGKNHVGTFHTPALVWSNVDFLERLPVVERQAALCEVIKNVVAIRPGDYDEVSALLNPAADYTAEEYLRIIELTIEQKTTVMGDDAFEKGEALVLEYGHTVGHAIEVAMKGQLTHGLAVGIGMTVAMETAQALDVTDERVGTMLLELLERLGAPVTIPNEATTDELMRRVRLDNKRGYLKQTPGRRDMVLLEAPGRPIWTDDKPLIQVPDAVIRAAIGARRAPSVAPLTGPGHRIGRSHHRGLTVRAVDH
jgi:3-dehydroquinate synthase/2-deoxy-scyllo-inosose synthase